MQRWWNYKLKVKTGNYKYMKLTELLRKAAIEYPDRGIILVKRDEEDRIITYKELYAKSLQIAHLLRFSYNITPNSKIIISVEKSDNFILLFWGAVIAKCIPCLMPSSQHGHKNSISSNRLKNTLNFINSAIIISNDSTLVDEYANNGKKTIYAPNIFKQIEISQIETELTDLNLDELACDDNELAVLQFSSGSTGFPKGVMLSNSNIIANLKLKTIADEITSDDKIVHWMPYYHDYGLFGNHLLCVYNKITEIKIEPYTFLRDPTIFLRKIAEYKGTICGGTTPTGLEILANKARNLKEKLDLSTIKILSIGAEMIPTTLYNNLEPLFNMGLSRSAFRPGYGLAEATLIVSFSQAWQGDKIIKLNRDSFNNGILKLAKDGDAFCEFLGAGKVIHGIDVRIVDEKSNPLPLMSLGEIQIKGECVTKGYYNNQDATEELLNDGWLNSGDLGFFDTESTLFIVGRKKEIIIVNGQNFHPFDIESLVISKFGNLIEKSLFTSYYSHVEKREIVLHFFSVKDRSISLQQVEEFVSKCNTYIANKMSFAPNYSVKINKGDIPRTSSSKLMRRAIAEKFQSGQFAQSIIKNNNKRNYKQVLNEIWMDILEISSTIEDNDNFFSLGGDSIRSMLGVSRIEESLNVKLENNFFYKYPIFLNQVEFMEHQINNNCIQAPSSEYELLVRELICEVLEVPESEIKFNEPFIGKASSLSKINKAMQHLVNVVTKITIGDIVDKESIEEIANVIQKRYSTSEDKLFPLMDFQETLFYHSKSFIRNEPTGLSCYIICRTLIKGQLDVECLNKTFNYLINCHPILHSILSEESDKPEMITLSSYDKFKINYMDISALSEAEQKYLLDEADIKDHDYRFDLKTYPLFYSNVYKTGELRYEFAIHIDHQLIDGFSFFQLIKEMASVYNSLKKGESPVINKETGMLFADYVQVEKLRSKTKRYKSAMDFALSVFKDIPEKISLPMKQQPALVGDVHFRTLHTVLDAELMLGVVGVMKGIDGVSLNSILMAAYFKLMNLWSGQNDLIINMPLLNREQHLPNSHNVLGSFLDIFPIRVQTSPKESIIDIAKKIESFVRIMLEYPISSIELSRKIAEQENLKQGSLSGIIFSNSIYMLPNGISKSFDDLEIEVPNVHTGAPGTYIDLVMYTWEGKWCFDWNYVIELFDLEFIQQLSNQLTSILTQFINDKDSLPCCKRSCSDILPNSYMELLSCSNQTAHDFPKKTIQEQIKEMVNIFPEREALSFNDISLTYKEFWAKSNQLSWFLKDLGVNRGDKVALLLNRTIDLPIIQLGIIIAGGVYVPIDPSYPSDRIKYMIDDCGAQVLISQGIHINNICSSYTENIKKCLLIDNENVQIPELYTKYTKQDVERYKTDECEFCNTPDDLIYMIYTSGSTGQPKGTMLRHRNVSNFLYYEREAFEVDYHKKFALITSYSFDMTITSNWLPFITGASLHILSDEETKDIEVLLHFIEDKKINFLNVTPSHFSMLVNTLGFLKNPVTLSKQMTIMLGAEIINVSDINRWLESYPNHKFINEYGPTETTVASTFFPIPVESDDKCHLNIVPIGKPIYNTQVYVLNEDLQPTLPNVPGILYIGGRGVSCGYHNKEERTNSVFITNPVTGDENDIVYNTGDLVKMSETGDIIFIGRKDFQVNVRGYRIELGEIENAMLTVPNIVEVCADIQYDVNNQATVVVFFVTADNIEINRDDIMSIIQTKIPLYMLPSSIKRLQYIPISANGKTDKKQLPNIANDNHNLVDRVIVAPIGSLQCSMVKVWKKVLGIPEVSITDDFWDIGGDSIRSVRLIKELREIGLENINLKDLFEKPTIKDLSENINCKQNNKVENIICLKHNKDAKIRLLCLPYAAGTPAMYSNFASHFPSNINIYTAQFPGHGDDRELKITIEEVSELLVDELKQSDSNIPLYMIGYSYSCYVAYDICKRLEKEKYPINGVIMIGGTPPTFRDTLMELFSNSNQALLDHSRVNDFLNEELMAMLSEVERTKYLEELRVDTKAMVMYNFTGSKLSTPLYTIVGDKEESIIKDNQQIWESYFTEVTHLNAPGGHVLINKYHMKLAFLVKKIITLK